MQKRWLILSDSHGDEKRVFDILTHWGESITDLLFLGDGAKEIVEAAYIFPEINFQAVIGNNDFSIKPNGRVTFPLENLIEVGQQKIYMTHGHIASYKEVHNKVSEQAKLQRAEIAFYGHLHIPFSGVINGVHLLNPGSVSYPRGGSKASYLVADFKESEGLTADSFRFFDAKKHTNLAI